MSCLRTHTNFVGIPEIVQRSSPRFSWHLQPTDFNILRETMGFYLVRTFLRLYTYNNKSLIKWDFFEYFVKLSKTT